MRLPFVHCLVPDRHGRQYGRKISCRKGNWSISGELTRKECVCSSTCCAGAYSPWAPPFAPPTPLRSPPLGFLRFVRRLHCYYDEVRLLVSVHHWLRLLAFPMRTAVHTQHATTAARYKKSPRFRCDPFARDVALDRGRASAPRLAVPHMLPSDRMKTLGPCDV